MKTSLFSASMILSIGISSAVAQTVDTSTGTVLDSSAAPSAAVDPSVPTRLAAEIAPSKDDSKVKGIVRFSLAGDAVNVSGRLDGLEANQRYRIAIQLPAAVTPSTGSETSPSQAGQPDAGAPEAGQPVAPQPAAGTPAAGKPDGTSRPGASGAGTQGSTNSGSRRDNAADNETAETTAKAAGDLGTLVADAAGGANINTTLRNATLTTGVTAIIGQTVTISPAPDTDAGEPTEPVAEGKIEAAKAPAGEPTP